MYIIILPFFIVAIVIGIISIVKSIKLFLSKKSNFIELFLGVLTSLLIFSLIVLIYKVEEKAWTLSIYFGLPIFMIFIPFIGHLITKSSSNKKKILLSHVLLISVGISLILSLVLHNFVFSLLDFLESEKIH